MHSTNINTVIGTQKCVYTHSCLGNLDRTQIGEIVRFVPLQDRFYSNSQRGFPVAVHSLTTQPTFIDGIVFSSVPPIDCTAVGTPFRSVVSINLIKRDLEHLRVGFKKPYKPTIRNPANFLVGFFVKLPLPPSNIFQFLNRNVGVIGFSKIYDFFSNLTTSCLNKIKLLMSDSFKTLSCPMRAIVSETFKIISSSCKSLLLYGNIFAKIELLNNFRSRGIENSNTGEGRRTNIDPNNTPLIYFCFGELFFKNNGNPTVLENGNIVKKPSILYKSVKSSELLIGFNRNHNVFSGGISNFKTRVSPFRFNVFKPSLVKTDGTSGKMLSVVQNVFSVFPNIFPCFLNNIRGQEGGFTYV